MGMGYTRGVEQVSIFDREGYSPAFFAEMWEKRIARQTYHKYTKDDWPEAEFLEEEEIELIERKLTELKEKRKQTPKHLPLQELPEEERFRQLAPTRKQFLDTIKMIAYRAETTMSTIVRKVLARVDEARSLIHEIFTPEADLIPHEQEKTLTIRLHHLTNHLSDQATRVLAEELNATETL
ncbi:MAG: hypothetical protein C4527_13445 [Candidatus Omnitrophota bacterium]|jgi:hypothetical protein|nr:MAG: hypothetical protein C4527_13445 [Candidatus Omnitrophota bacterium]